MKINSERDYRWRAVDHEGEVLENYVTRRRDRKAALKLIRKSMKNYGQPKVIGTDKLRSYRAAMKVIGNADRQEKGRWLNNRVANSHFHFDDENERCMVSRRLRHFRHLSVITVKSITTSTTKGISKVGSPSNKSVQLLSRSGSISVLSRMRDYSILRRVRVSLTTP